MDIAGILFKQNVIMLVYLVIGFWLYKRKMVTKTGSAEIGKLLLNVIMPVAIVKSYIRDYSGELRAQLGVSFLLSLLSLVLAILISSLFFNKDKAVRRFGAAFSNAGFIGIPLIQATLGDHAVFYVASFVALLNILQWTYGVYQMTRDRNAVSFAKIRTNPIVISFLIGLLLFFLPVKVPDAAMGVLGTIAAMNGPLAMIVLGTYLAQIRLTDLFTDKQTYLCTAVRLLVIPAATMLMLCLVPEKYSEIRMAILLVASAPVGSNVGIFAQLYNKEYKDAVKDVCLSTIAGILTMPVVLGVANMIW